MKPARIRELQAFVIIFVGVFLAVIFTAKVIDYFVRPLLWWTTHGELVFPAFILNEFFRLSYYAAGLAVFVAVVLVITGKQSGRW